jgi:hypothetical protein
MNNNCDRFKIHPAGGCMHQRECSSANRSGLNPDSEKENENQKEKSALGKASEKK